MASETHEAVLQPRVGLLGSDAFLRELASRLRPEPRVNLVSAAALAEIWSEMSSRRPTLLVLEVAEHSRVAELRAHLQSARARFNRDLHICLACMSSQALTSVGELLFEEDSTEPSLLIDSMVFSPPALLSACPSLTQQVVDVVACCDYELQRRTLGEKALPALGDPAWVQSMADPKSRDLWYRWIPRYAAYTNENPLVLGETGSGKTRIAYALHHFSGRSGNFVSLTPRDFSSSELVQAELFGAVPGAYTGAVEKWGLVKSAEGGTLFFDELQSIDKDLQGKLITFIENKAYRRVGSSESIKANVRFVFAANKNLAQMLSADILRDDFAYRLERVLLELPALRERPLDIAAAIAWSLGKIKRQRAGMRQICGFSLRALAIMMTYPWPGNLRQLENAVARCCERADMAQQSLIDEDVTNAVIGHALGARELDSQQLLLSAAQIFSQRLPELSAPSLKEALRLFEDSVVSHTLAACGGAVEQAAQLLREHEEVIRLALLPKGLSTKNAQG